MKVRLRIALLMLVSCVKGLVNESNVKCDRIGSCREELERETRSIYFGLMLSYPDPRNRDSLIGAFDDGHDIAPAAYLAVEQINNRSDILSDYDIKVIRADGGCNVTERSVIGVNELSCSCKPIVGIIGPSCGTSSMVVGQLTGNQRFSMITIHYGQLEILGDRSVYPYAFGILGSNAVYVAAMVGLVKQNNWKRIAILFSEDEIDIARGKEIQERVRALSGFEISFTSGIYDNFIPLEEVRDTFTRVIIVLGPPGITLCTVCLAYHKQMLFPNYQWVFIERIDSDFHSISFRFNVYTCSELDISVAINGSVNLLFGTVAEGVDVETVTDIGVTPQEYQEGYNLHIEEYMREFNVSSTAVEWAKGFYDAVWSLAFALNDSLEELNMNLTRIEAGSDVLAQTIGKHMVRMDFRGISGRIKFDKNTGYNVDTTVNIYQYRQNITSTNVGVYTLGNLTLFLEACPTFISATFQERIVHVDIAVGMLLLTFTALTLLLAIPLQIVNIVYRDYKAIKASSPWLNHLIFVGCYLIVIGTALYVLMETYKNIDSVANLKRVLCNVIPWILTTGPTLIIGTILVKTWRLHRIYTRSILRIGFRRV